MMMSQNKRQNTDTGNERMRDHTGWKNVDIIDRWPSMQDFQKRRKRHNVRGRHRVRRVVGHQVDVLLVPAVESDMTRAQNTKEMRG